MRNLFRMLCLAILCAVSFQTRAGFKHQQAHDNALQAKQYWIRIEFRKYDTSKLESLLNELNRHPEDITDVYFNSENRQLTVYYGPETSADDIYQIVSEYISDFKKIGGTELE